MNKKKFFKKLRYPVSPKRVSKMTNFNYDLFKVVKRLIMLFLWLKLL